MLTIEEVQAVAKNVQFEACTGLYTMDPLVLRCVSEWVTGIAKDEIVHATGFTTEHSGAVQPSEHPFWYAVGHFEIVEEEFSATTAVGSQSNKGENLTTLEAVRAAAKNVRDGIWEGLYEMDPLTLRCKQAGNGIAEGEIVHADRFDYRRYPGTVHLVEKGFNWPVRFFDIVKEEAITVAETRCENHQISHDLVRGCICAQCGVSLCGSQNPSNFLIHCNLGRHGEDVLCEDTSYLGIEPWPMGEAHDD